MNHPKAENESESVESKFNRFLHLKHSVYRDRLLFTGGGGGTKLRKSLAKKL